MISAKEALEASNKNKKGLLEQEKGAIERLILRAVQKGQQDCEYEVPCIVWLELRAWLVEFGYKFKTEQRDKTKGVVISWGE